MLHQQWIQRVLLVQCGWAWITQARRSATPNESWHRSILTRDFDWALLPTVESVVSSKAVRLVAGAHFSVFEYEVRGTSVEATGHARSCSNSNTPGFPPLKTHSVVQRQSPCSVFLPATSARVALS